jgi:cupin 2 domain-containing protein
MKIAGNIFKLSNKQNHDSEEFDTLFDGAVKIERILSSGHITPHEYWYNQPKDEWVLLIQGSARLVFADNQEVTLEAGDYIFIPAHQKHRVSYTSSEPSCVWLAIHGELKNIFSQK